MVGKIFLLISMMLVRMVESPQAEREFSDPYEKYKITLVGNWRPGTFADVVGRRQTEFIGQDRSSGKLRITRERLGGRTLSEIVHGEQESLAFRVPCLFTGEEDFEGVCTKGTRVALYYFERGNRMSSTYYFLREKDEVWVLRFTGSAGSPDLAPQVTDKMASSFCPSGIL